MYSVSPASPPPLIPGKVMVRKMAENEVMVRKVTWKTLARTIIFR
jgi:hypothetical protein